MSEWKKQLYERYVSSGQATCNVTARQSSLQRHFPYFEHLIRNHLAPDRNIAIADVACGDGSLLHCLRGFGYHRLEGVDLSPEQVKVAHARGVEEAQCGEMDAFLRARTGSFDVIFLMDILEHLEREELLRLLGQVNCALRSGGQLIIHVPNAGGLFGMLIRYGDLTHENCFTVRSIRQALTCSGFMDIQCFEDKPVVHGVKSFLRRCVWNVLTIPHRLIMIAESGEMGAVLSRNMLVVSRKAESLDYSK